MVYSIYIYIYSNYEIQETVLKYMYMKKYIQDNLCMCVIYMWSCFHIYIWSPENFVLKLVWHHTCIFSHPRLKNLLFYPCKNTVSCSWVQAYCMYYEISIKISWQLLSSKFRFFCEKNNQSLFFLLQTEISTFMIGFCYTAFYKASILQIENLTTIWPSCSKLV